MARLRKAHWVVVVTTEDGGTACYGPWASDGKATEIAAGLRARSVRYSGSDDHPDLTVKLELLESWPGYEVATGVRRA